MPRQNEWFGSILLCNAFPLQRALRKTFCFSTSGKGAYSVSDAKLLVKHKHDMLLYGVSDLGLLCKGKQLTLTVWSTKKDPS